MPARAWGFKSPLSHSPGWTSGAKAEPSTTAIPSPPHPYCLFGSSRRHRWRSGEATRPRSRSGRQGPDWSAAVGWLAIVVAVVAAPTGRATVTISRAELNGTRLRIEAPALPNAPSRRRGWPWGRVVARAGSRKATSRTRWPRGRAGEEDRLGHVLGPHHALEGPPDTAPAEATPPGQTFVQRTPRSRTSWSRARVNPRTSQGRASTSVRPRSLPLLEPRPSLTPSPARALATAAPIPRLARIRP